MENAENHWFTGSVEQRVVHASRGPVEYADVGQGIPVLYFHGNDVGNDAAVLLEKSLIDDGFRLIVPNRPGYYGTPLQSGRSPDDCADLAVELLDQLGLGRVAVIGTSGGGPPASRFAARHPQRCAALVLQCALAHPLDSGRWMPRRAGWLWPFFRYLWLFRPVLRLGHRQQTRKRARGVFAADCMSKVRFAELGDSAALQFLEPLLAASTVRCSERPTGIENDWANWAGNPWLTPGSVGCKTLIQHDRDDPAVPIAHAHWARHCIPCAQFCELHVGGHLIWVGRDAEKMRHERTAFIRRHADQFASPAGLPASETPNRYSSA
jgi:pimeloyl-ACP methyl ester carboxylesterase